MADVKISALTENTSPAASDVIPVSRANGSATNKVTIQNIVDFATTSGGAVGSDATGVSGAETITNIIRLSQSEYNAISSPDASTLYVIED
tara:strand:+ start:10703 stop:10975 length:273 start_codon:yes stop_codon:yes gene_type:complete